MADARFEDGVYTDQPLRLGAETPEDLQVISSLVQDSVGLSGEVSWMPKRRRMVMLLNRFRWEDRDEATRTGRTFERVRAALIVDDALRVQSQGLPVDDPDTVYAILALAFDPSEDGAGQIQMTLAGDGMLSLDVECINARLIDLTRPWEARNAPDHGDL